MLLSSLLLLLATPLQEIPPRTAADWDRVALEAGACFDTDREMLAWLRALELEESDRRRRELGRLAGVRERLRLTLRHDTEEELEWLELSADGSVLVTSDGTMRVWDARTGERLWTAVGWVPRFSTEGRFLASCWRNGARVHEARTGRFVGSVQTPPDTKVYLAIPDSTGELLATTTTDLYGIELDQLTLWDLREGKALFGPIPVYDQWPGSQAFDAAGNSFAHQFEHEGEEEDEYGVALWSRGAGYRVVDRGPFAHYSPLAFDATGERLAVNIADHVHLFDTASGERCAEPLPLGYATYHLAFREDGAIAASGWGDACVWDVEGRRGMGAPRGKDGLDFWGRDKYEDGPDDLSPDGRRYVLPGHADTLRIWSTETGDLLGGAPLLHGIQADYAAFAGDNLTVASGNRAGLVRVWDVPEAGPPTLPPTFTRSRVEEREDGVHLSRWESVVLLVEVATGETREIQRGGRLADLAFEQDGRGLAVGWENGRIDAWSLDGERLAGPLRQPVHAFGLSWRGDRLLAVELGAIRCWDLEQGAPEGFAYDDYTPAEAYLDSNGEDLVYFTEETVERWSLSSWTPKPSIEAPEGLEFLAVGPNGWKAVRGGNGRLSVLDARHGRVLAEAAVVEPPSYDNVRFASDGVDLLWADDDEDTGQATFWHWETESLALPRKLPFELESIAGFAWHAGSQLLAVGRDLETRGGGTAVRFLDLRDGSSRGASIEVPGLVDAAALDPLGEWCALGWGRWVDEDHPISWAEAPPRDLPPRVLEATIDDPGRLELREARTGEVVAVHPILLGGLPVAIDRDGTVVHLWGPSSLREVDPGTGAWQRLGVRSTNGWLGGIAIDAVTGGRMVLHERNRGLGHVQLLDGAMEPTRPHGFYVEHSPDLVALGGSGRWAALSRREEVVMIELPSTHQPLVLETGLGPATALALDRRGARLAVGGRSGKVQLFELPSGARRPVELDLDHSITALAYDASGRLAVATLDGAVRVVDDEGRVVEERQPLTSPAAALAWLADGELVAVAHDRSYSSWSVTGGVDRTDLRLELDAIAGARTVFDPTGTRLAVAHADDSICVWRVEDWSLCGPPCWVEGLGGELFFGSDGNRLIVEGKGGYSSYDISTGERIAGPLDGRQESLWTEPRATWAGPGELGEAVYRVVDLESGEVLRSVPWSARPMVKGQFHVWGGGLHPSGDRLLVGCVEYLTLLGLEDGVVTPLGTRRRPFGEEVKHFRRFLDDGRVFAGVRTDCKPAELSILDFENPGDVRLEGNPSELRRLWEPRLGLQVLGERIVRRDRGGD